MNQQEHERTLEREIEHLRTRLDRSLSELDRRRQEYTDVRLQLRRHQPLLVKTAVVAGLTVAGVAALLVLRARRRQEPVHKLERLRRAMRRAVDRPGRVAREPPPAEKVLVSVGTSLGSTVATLVARRLAARAWTSPRGPGARRAAHGYM